MVSEGFKSETDETTGTFANIPHDNLDYPALILDTPGFGDSEGREAS